MLSDEEINDFLRSSEPLHNTIRSAANRPKASKIDASLLRRWLNMPASSNELLKLIPGLYAKEMTGRASKGEYVARTVGVRALLSLNEEDMSPERFAQLLADFRANPTPEPPPDAEAAPELESARNGTASPDLPKVASGLDSGGGMPLIAVLRQQAEVLAAELSAAAKDVTIGRQAVNLADQTAAWNVQVADIWAALGVSTVPADSSFDALEARCEQIALEESTAKARLKVREEKRARLAQLRNTVIGLEPMKDEPTFRDAYQQASSEIATLEHELEINADDQPVLLSDRTNEPVDNSTLEPASNIEPDDLAEADGNSVAENKELSPELSHALEAGAETNGSDGYTRTDRPLAASEQAAQSNGTCARHDQSANGLEPITAPQKDSPLDLVYAEISGTADPVESSSDQPLGTDYSADLARHVREGRFGAAWLVAQAARLPANEIEVYRLAASGFNCAPGGIDPSEVLISITTALSGGEELAAQSARLALAATLRASLAAGWTPRSELEAMENQANLGAEWRELVAAAIAAGDRNYQHLQDFGGRLDVSIDDVLDQARTVRNDLTSLRIKFARADKVLKYLLRSSEPIGAAFEAILADTTGSERRESLTEALTSLESPDALIEAVDAIVSKSQQRQYPIQSHARARLRRAVEEAADCVAHALNATVVVASDSRAAVAQEARHNLVAAARAIDTDLNADLPGDVALAHLLQWILAPEAPARMTSELQVLLHESLPAISPIRDEQGLPQINADNGAAVVEELRTPRTNHELFDIYLSRGDLLQARAAAQQDPDLVERLNAERSSWRRRLDREVSALRAEIARTYADEATSSTQAEAEAKLVTPTEYRADRFDCQMAELDAMRNALRQHRTTVADLLSHRVTVEVSDSADQERINALIANEDFVGANELLALARSGALPKSDSDDSPAGAHVFGAFAEALSSLDKSEFSSIHAMVAKFAAGEVSDATAHGDMERLRSWENLNSRRGQTGRSGLQGSLASILRALGLDIRGEATRQTGQGVRHLQLYRINASPLDGSLVPALGSQATHYMVATTGDHKLLRETLASGFPTKNGPNIVLFDGVLSMDERRQCLNVCRDKKISAIVVDHAVAAFVAARYPRSFRAVQQITLPFTCFTHYTIVAGNVPDEVFVGRNDELAQLTDRAGSLFVYGGRQLGKSALLRKIQRDFNAVPDHHAIFIDLNSHGIGTWADSQQLWPVLYNELAKVPSTGIRPNMAVRNHDAVVRLIRQWLDGKDSRRLLLLLDEADAFLDNESADGPNRFKSIGPLKGLFDDTEGRFKPVFAGLHKVQRLQNVANTPLAHGGRDVLVGPLAAKPARNLVVKPLEALGYRFERPESVWRLLAFTNLQPGLIQIVCNDLVAELQSRVLRTGEPMIAISEADIDKVTGDEHTRKKISEKLRLTIALEDRYRVIALAVAIMSMEDNFRERYSAGDIREHCEMYWPQGFEDLNSASFEVYLDELIGLGVLIKDRQSLYSVRSPNIVTMLGTKEQLETELDENKEQFELPHEYNPRSTRRQVTINNVVVRSPLSEHELSKIIPVQKKYPALDFVVIGSEALGVTHVAPVLKSVGNERGTDVTILDGSSEGAAAAISTFKWTSGGVGAPRALVIDASRANTDHSDEVRQAILSVRHRTAGHLIVVYGPNGLGAADSLTEGPSAAGVKLVTLEKWSGDGIRSWHDNPFNTPADRRELLKQSGGWPDLVERAVTEVTNRGIGHTEEWQRLSGFPESPDTARSFLTSAGIADRHIPILLQWAQLDSQNYELISDVAAVLDYGPEKLDELGSLAADLTRLGAVHECNGEYMIDPVVARAVNRSV